MALKSKPSEPACDIKTTFIFSPLILSSLVIAFKSASLFGDKRGSPVIIMYLADFKSEIMFPLVLGGGVLNNDLPLCLVNPISSNARAIGIRPASI